VNTSVTIALAGGIGALAGALITACVSLVTTWLSRRHEQRRWRLDKRLEAYVDFNAAANAWMLAYTRAGRVTDKLNDDLMRLADATRRVQLLAPPATREKAEDVFQTVADLSHYFTDQGGKSITPPSTELEPFTSGLADLAELQRADVQGR
jgi:hypothetical protein